MHHLSSNSTLHQGFNHKCVSWKQRHKVKYILSLKLKQTNTKRKKKKTLLHVALLLLVLLLPSSPGSFQPACLAALRANSLWRYYGYWKACKPLNLYLQEKEKRVWVSERGRARSWYRRWPHCKWSEQLRFLSGRPLGHLVAFAANCRPLLNYIIVPINYPRRAYASW